MISLPRSALSGFALAFGFYHAVLAFLNFDSYASPAFAIAGILLYLAGLAIAVFSTRGLRLNESSAWVVFAIALIVPLTMSAASEAGETVSYSTWYVSGIATIMAILMVRQHVILAWLGASFMIIQTLVWGGLGVLFNAGVFGAFLLVLASQATSSIINSSGKAAAEFRELSIATNAKTAASSAARSERQRRIQQTLKESLPLLQLVVDSAGRLSNSEAKNALLKELELRDQIRGRGLLNENLKAATRAARERGIEVQLLDDGGLENVPELRRQELLERAALELQGITSGKVVIRAVAGESWVLTIAAIRKDSDRPDLFLRL